jgi:hypothetical protein
MKDYVNSTFILYKGPQNRDLPAGITETYPLRYRAPQYVCVLMVTKKSNSIRKVRTNLLHNVSEFLVQGEWHRYRKSRVTLWALNMEQILLRQWLQYSERENLEST